MSSSPFYQFLTITESTSTLNLIPDSNTLNTLFNPLEPLQSAFPPNCGQPSTIYQYLRTEPTTATQLNWEYGVIGTDKNLLSSAVSTGLNSPELPIPISCPPEPQPFQFKMGIGQDSSWFFPNPFAEPDGTFKPIYLTSAGEPALQFGEPQSKQFIPFEPSYVEPVGGNSFEVASILTSNTNTFQPNSNRIPFNASFKGRFLIGANGNIATIDQLTKTIPNMVNYISGNSCYSGHQVLNTATSTFNGNNQGIVFAVDKLQAVNYVNPQINTDNSSLQNHGPQSGIIQPFLYNFGGASYSEIPTQGTFYMNSYFVNEQHSYPEATFIPAGFGTSTYIIQPDSLIYLEPSKLPPSLYASQGQDIGPVITYDTSNFTPSNGYLNYQGREPNAPGIRYIRDRNDYSQFTIGFTNIEPNIVNNYWIQEPYQFTVGEPVNLLPTGPTMQKVDLEIPDKWKREASQKTIDMTNINYLFSHDKNSDLNCVPLLTDAIIGKEFNPNEPLNSLVQHILPQWARSPPQGDTWKVYPTINKQLEPDKVSEPENIGYRFLNSPAFMFSNFMQASKNPKLGNYVQMAIEMKINAVPYDYYYLVKEPEDFKKIENNEADSVGLGQFGADLRNVQLNWVDIDAAINSGSGSGAGSAWFTLFGCLFTQNFYSQLANTGDWKDVNYFALEPNENGSNQLFYRGLEPAQEPALEGNIIQGYDPWQPGDPTKNKGPPDIQQLRYNYNLLYVFLGKSYASALNNNDQLKIQTRINYEVSISQLFFLGFFSQYWLEEGFFRTSEPEMNLVFRTEKSAGGIMPEGGWTSPIMKRAKEYPDTSGGPFGFFYETSLRSGNNINPSFSNWSDNNNTEGVKGFLRALNNFEGAFNKVRDIINETVNYELPGYLNNLEYTFHTTDGGAITRYDAYNAYVSEPNLGLEPDFQVISPLANPSTAAFDGSDLINKYLLDNSTDLPSTTIAGEPFNPNMNDVKSLGSIWYWLNSLPLEPVGRNLEPERITIFEEFWNKGKYDQNANFGSSFFNTYVGGEPDYGGCLEGYDYNKNYLFKNENQILAGAIINRYGGTYASNKLIQNARNKHPSCKLAQWKMLGCETSILSMMNQHDQKGQPILPNSYTEEQKYRTFCYNFAFFTNLIEDAEIDHIYYINLPNGWWGDKEINFEFSLDDRLQTYYKNAENEPAWYIGGPEAEPSYQINFKTFIDNLIENKLSRN